MCASVQKLNLYEDDKVVHILSISYVHLLINNITKKRPKKSFFDV